MSIDWCQDGLEFRRRCLLPVGDGPHLLRDRGMRFNVSLVQEELGELEFAHQTADLPGFADAIEDAIYFLIGLAWECGIDLRPVHDEVHRANMTKSPDHRSGGRAT